MKKTCANTEIKGNKGTFRKRPTAATSDVINTIRKRIKMVNPPTQRAMANKCGVSLGTVNRVIAKTLKSKLRKKCAWIYGLGWRQRLQQNVLDIYR